MNDMLSKDNVNSLKVLISSIVKSTRMRGTEDTCQKKKDRHKRSLMDMLYADACKTASSELDRPPDEDLRRMYDVVQADARLTKRIAGLGFGNTGDAYRKAAIKLRILAIMNVLRDGKNIRNDIVHKPGYVPPEASTSRALQEYDLADRGISEFLRTRS